MKTKVLVLTMLLFTGICVHAQKSSTKLVGTWKLLSAQYGGEESVISGDLTYMKFYTPTHFCSVLYMKDGLVKQAIGGSYSYTGDTCVENVAFAEDKRARILNTQSTFKIVLKGNKMELTGHYGDGTQTLKEVWEKVQ